MQRDNTSLQALFMARELANRFELLQETLRLFCLEDLNFFIKNVKFTLHFFLSLDSQPKVGPNVILGYRTPKILLSYSKSGLSFVDCVQVNWSI
jgi:hypothetical protein